MLVVGGLCLCVAREGGGGGGGGVQFSDVGVWLKLKLIECVRDIS